MTNEDLKQLEKRGLLTFDPENGLFDMHPLVRQYAYERLSAHERVLSHQRAYEHLKQDNVGSPETFEQLVILIDIFHQAVSSNNFKAAYEIYVNRMEHQALWNLGLYQTRLRLLTTLVDGWSQQPANNDSEQLAEAFKYHAYAEGYS